MENSAWRSLRDKYTLNTHFSSHLLSANVAWTRDLPLPLKKLPSRRAVWSAEAEVTVSIGQFCVVRRALNVQNVPDKKLKLATYVCNIANLAPLLSWRHRVSGSVGRLDARKIKQRYRYIVLF